MAKVIELQNKNISEKRRRANKNSRPKKVRVVVFFVGLVMTLAPAYLVKALFDLQYTQYGHYSLLASQQHWKKTDILPRRGDILDANGNVLAGSTYVYTIGITPRHLKSISNKSLVKNEIVKEMASILELDENEILEAAADENATYVQLAKNIDKEKADNLSRYLKKNDVGGVTMDAVAKRYYPNGHLASQLLGYADAADGLLVGRLGLETQYNDVLTGTQGATYSEVSNGGGSVLPYSTPTTVEVKDGYNLRLNIIGPIQDIAEKEIKEAYDVYDVQGHVSVIMMRKTGEVLANANYPDFDPNEPAGKPDFISNELWETLDNEERTKIIMSNTWRNHAISDANEPGSTFKVFTAAMALEEATTSEEVNYSDAPYVYDPINGKSISCWMEKTIGGNHGTNSLVHAFSYSCNPVFVQLARSVGIDKFYNYVENFGFNELTGIDLPAEATGIIYQYGKERPDVIDMASFSIGESAVVTPIQLITGYAAVANGGDLVIPQVANALLDEDGGIVAEFKPEVKRSVFSEQTANRVRDLMKGVVQDGTGQAAFIPGYNVAGKTGTATYDVGEFQGAHVLLFGGYAPADDPEIVVLVVIDRPQDNSLGSSAASTIASRIIEHTLSYLQVDRIMDEEDREEMVKEIAIPDNILGMTLKDAREELYRRGFSVILGDSDISDESGKVATVYPPVGTMLHKNGKVVLYTSPTPHEEDTIIPDFSGKNLEEIFHEAYKNNLNIHIDGNLQGVAISYEVYKGEETDTSEEEETKEQDPIENREADQDSDEDVIPAEEKETARAGTAKKEVGEAPEERRVKIGTIIRVELE